MHHARQIETLTSALRDQDAVTALFLSGSYGTGRADAYSDIDFVLVTPEGPSDAVAALWKEAVGQTGEIVLWWDRNTRPVLINAITADWTRIDLVMLKPDQLGPQSQHALTPLIDPTGLYDTLPATAARPQISAKRISYLIEEFRRVLGLFTLVIGRGGASERRARSLPSA